MRPRPGASDLKYRVTYLLIPVAGYTLSPFAPTYAYALIAGGHGTSRRQDTSHATFAGRPQVRATSG
jgi:hypothetical protein